MLNSKNFWYPVFLNKICNTFKSYKQQNMIKKIRFFDPKSHLEKSRIDSDYLLKRTDTGVDYQTWDRLDDWIAFYFLQEVCIAFKISIIDFLQEAKVKDSLLSKVLNEMKLIIDWKSDTFKLRQRFLKMVQSKSFSSRETKLLKKLVTQNKTQKNVCWETILFHFPGKTINSLKQKCKAHWKFNQSKMEI